MQLWQELVFAILAVSVFANLVAWDFEPFQNLKNRYPFLERFNCPKCIGLWTGLVVGLWIGGVRAALYVGLLSSYMSYLVYKIYGDWLDD